MTPPSRFDAILSEKSGRGFSRFYYRSIKASAEERGELLLSATNVVSSLWVQLFILAIHKGNSKHDTVTSSQPINFSVSEASQHLTS